MSIHVSMYSEARTSDVLICHFLPYSFEKGSLMESGARLASL